VICERNENILREKMVVFFPQSIFYDTQIIILYYYLKSASQNFGLFSENFKDIFSSKINF